MSQRLFFFIAVLTIIIGLLGLTGVFTFNQTSIEDTSIPTFQVAKLQKPMKKGEPLKRTNIRYFHVREQEAMQNGITHDTTLQIVPGTIAAKDLSNTDFLSQRDFITPNDKGYIEAAIQKGMTPYSFRLKSRDFLGSGVAVGDYIDVLVLTSDEQNIGETGRGSAIQSFRTLSVSPLLHRVKILAIEEEDDSRDMSLPITIELAREQIGKMVIARRIGVIEVIKSLDQSEKDTGLNADTHDVLPNFKSVTEIRGQNKAFN
ncbi:Flp pilus assembly protein CpaB [Enterovibrio nigricans]|uniref:Pilus assembly protein CpaB n=1 Tax=Enterovibrio nigricans DSM 22720 TaxID=1121868 RepID=A0A1T4VVN8_9GAMM|nr:Flp pilus assembly protein CpaB [Enterovibrio nigricans]PKF48967.1 Flp pilus assembly protein CpaB [Enterovibrio nigricans]SKA69017.1 pilus assembly protein CpaB [Enterovibrio nigricans DSM 22720]